MRLPVRISALSYPSGMMRARCECDWTSGLCETDAEVEAMAERHARLDAWCFVHRDLTEVGLPAQMSDHDVRPSPVALWRDGG